MPGVRLIPDTTLGPGDDSVEDSYFLLVALLGAKNLRLHLKLLVEFFVQPLEGVLGAGCREVIPMYS